MNDMKKCAQKDVLKKLIALAQEAMMDGMGESEEAGESVLEDMAECPAEEMEEEMAGDESADSEDEEGFGDYVKREMKKGNKSPLKSGRRVAMIVASKAPSAPMAKGKF